MKLSSRALMIALFLFFQSCITLHAPYQRPQVDVPETWRIDVNESASYANFHWWEQFNDPVLNGLILESLENNNDLKAAIARVYQFIGNLDIVQSGFYPQVYGSGEALRQETSLALFPLPLEASRTSNQYFATISATYEVDIWGKIRSASEAALADLLGSVEARRTVVLTLVTSVAASYIQLRLFDKQLEISINTVRSRKEAYDLAVARFEGGLATELEAKQAEAEMENAIVQVIRFETAIQQQENLLSVLVGHPPHYIQRGLWLDNLLLPLDVPAGLPSQILEQRPDLLEAEDNVIAANANIGVARAQFFPNISLTGFYGNESIELHNLFTGPARAWEYGINLLQPLFTGGLLLGQLEVAKAEKWEAYYQYRQAVLNAFKEVDDALVTHQKSKELLKVETKRVVALIDVLRLANLQYSNGQVDYLNVLDAERTLFAAQLDHAEAMGQTFETLIQLYKSLGGGWVIEADNLTQCATFRSDLFSGASRRKRDRSEKSHMQINKQ